MEILPFSLMVGLPLRHATSNGSTSRVSFTSKEEKHDLSIESLAQTSLTCGNETLGVNKKPHSTSKCKSETVSFRGSFFQEDPPQLKTFDLSIYEACILRVASNVTIVDSMIFDNHHKLDLSSIHVRSQHD